MFYYYVQSADADVTFRCYQPKLEQGQLLLKRELAAMGIELNDAVSLVGLSTYDVRDGMKYTVLRRVELSQRQIKFVGNRRYPLSPIN